MTLLFDLFCRNGVVTLEQVDSRIPLLRVWRIYLALGGRIVWRVAR